MAAGAADALAEAVRQRGTARQWGPRKSAAPKWERRSSTGDPDET